MPFRLKKPKRQFLLQLPTDHRTNLIPPSQLAALQLTPPSLPPPNPISNALVCSRLQSVIQHLSGKPKGQTCLLKPNSKDKSVVNIVWIYLLVSSHTTHMLHSVWVNPGCSDSRVIELDTRSRLTIFDAASIFCLQISKGRTLNLDCSGAIRCSIVALSGLK